MLLRVRRQRRHVLSEPIAASAPLERLGFHVLPITLVPKEPTKERLTGSDGESPELQTELAILIRSERESRRFESRVNSELHQDALNIGTDHISGEPELRGDRVALRSLRQQAKHPMLLRRELREIRLAIHV